MRKAFGVFVLIFGMFFTVSADKGRENMREYLGLNAEQEQKFENLKNLCRAENSEIFAKLEELRKALFAEAGKNNADTAKINEIAAEIGKQHTLLSLCLVRQIQEVKKILTKEQFDKFIEFRQNKNKNFNQRHKQTKQK